MQQGVTRFVLALVLVVTLFSSHYALAFPEKGQNCIKCHKLETKELTLILKNLKVPNATALDVRLSVIKGLWEVSGRTNGQPFLLYVDFSKKYVTPGPIFENKTSANLTKQRLEELNQSRRVDFSRIDIRDAILIGREKAAIKTVVFTDPG